MTSQPIQTLINNYGQTVAKSYLLKRFSDPSNVGDFKFLFPNHISFRSPTFHNEILKAIAKGGKWAFAAPRGFAKSTITNVIGLAWATLTGKYRFILLISDTYTQAKLQLGSLKAELEQNPAIQFIYGDLRGDPWGEDRIVVNSEKGPVMIMALGAGMKIRGLKFLQFRPQLAVIDDLENLEMVYSAERREKLERWFNFDLQPGLAVPKNIIYIGTILHYHALLQKVITKDGKYSGWNTRHYQALIDNDTSLWPEAYTPEYLRSIRDDPSFPDYVGSIVFSQEYQNEPQDDQDRIIKLSWIKEYNYRGRINTFEGISDVQREDFFRRTLEVYAGVDPAIGQKETNDNFSMYVFGLDKTTGDELQLDLIHGKFSIDEQVEKIVNCCKEWKIDVLSIEANAYQAGLYQLVRTALQKAGLTTKINKVITDKDKIRRARIHSVAFEGGFVKLRTDHPKYAIIKKELEEFPFGENDDAFDSLMLAREGRVKPRARAFTNKPTGF